MTSSSRRSRVLLVLAGAAGLLLAALTIAVLLRSGRPFPVDTAVHDWFVDVRTPALTRAVRLLTATGSAPAYALAVAAGALAGGPPRRWWERGALAAAVAALVIIALRTRTASRAIRGVGTSAALLWAAGVGFSRIYLGVHWPGDVLGGWLLVTALACATAAWRPSARAVGSATVRPPGRGNGYGLP